VKDCIHRINTNDLQMTKPQSVSQQVQEEQEELMHAATSGYSQPVYHMTTFVQQLYMPGPHQPILVQQSGFDVDPRQGYVSALGAGISNSSMS
jgi:hypothetical protein